MLHKAQVAVNVFVSVFICAVTTIFIVWLPRWLLAYSAVLISFTAIAMFSSRSAPRYSLRAMFIATTLVAVVLGLRVWLAS
jgi:hypothetical protein